MLDIPDVRLRPDPAASGALHHSVARVLMTGPPLRRLAVRGGLASVLIGAVATAPGIWLLSAGRAPELAGPGSALITMGVCSAALTTVHHQAALVVAADALLDGRSITGRRARACARARWKGLARWTLIDLTPGWPLRLVVRGRAAWQHQDAAEIASPKPVDPTWPAVMLLVLPVLMFERMAGLDAVRRSRQLSAKRWGRKAQCRFRRDRAGTTTVLVSGAVLTLAGVVALWRHQSATLAGALLVAGLVLAITGLAAHNASRSVLAVALFRYARDGRASDPFDAPALADAMATAPTLIHLLAASGALVECAGSPIPIDKRRPRPDGR